MFEYINLEVVKQRWKYHDLVDKFVERDSVKIVDREKYGGIFEKQQKYPSHTISE